MFHMAFYYKFENDVIKYGTQTYQDSQKQTLLFENDVIKYGTQTVMVTPCTQTPFENDVIKYGTQTVRKSVLSNSGLRMM